MKPSLGRVVTIPYTVNGRYAHAACDYASQANNDYPFAFSVSVNPLRSRRVKCNRVEDIPESWNTFIDESFYPDSKLSDTSPADQWEIGYPVANQKTSAL